MPCWRWKRRGRRKETPLRCNNIKIKTTKENTTNSLKRLFSSEKRKEINVPKYVIERDIPGVGNLSAEQLQAISQKSCDVLRELGPQIQWLHSYVTGDKIYCIYIAQNEAMVRAHAQRGGFPANRISEIKQVIDPTTAEMT